MRLLAVAIGLTAACGATRASVLFDQSPPNLNATDIVDFRVADDFTLFSPSAVDGINFWYSAFGQTDLSSVTYAIYANSSGSLGSLLFSGTVTAATSFDSVDNTFFAALSFSDIDLAASTYWLELHGGVSLTDDNGGLTVWWDNADDNATHMALQSSNENPLALPSQPIAISGFEQQAFQIEGSVTPEPSAWILAGSGLAVLLGKRCRKSPLSKNAKVMR